MLGTPGEIGGASGNDFYPLVAGAFGQNVVVIWSDQVYGNGYFQLIDTSCATVGSAVAFIDNMWDNRVAMWRDGDFVIVYNDPYADYIDSGLFAQLYDNDGATVGPPFRITPPDMTAQDLAVETWGTDSFAVAWKQGSYIVGITR